VNIVCFEGVGALNVLTERLEGASVDIRPDVFPIGAYPDPPPSSLSPKLIKNPWLSVEPGADKTTNHITSNKIVVDNVEPIRPYTFDFSTFIVFNK
jgi:hypothetical protein